MRRQLTLFIAAIACLGWALAVQAQDTEARVLVHKAIKAHGGAEKLAQTSAAHVKAKGTLHVPMELSFTMEAWVQMPDKIKTAMELQVNNMNVAVTQGFDGKKAWLQVAGMTMDLNDDRIIQQYKEDMYAETVASLIALKDKKYQLDLLGDSKVKETEVVGLRISSQGHKDVSLFFDKKTTLLVKMEHRTVDAMSGQEVTQEKYLSDYKEVEGIPTAQRLVVHRDGKAFLDLEVTETRYAQRFDENMFAKP